MTDMLMTEAETTNDGVPSQDSTEGTTQQVENGQQAADVQDQQSQGDDTAGEDGGDQGEFETLGAPESYEFQEIEGVNFDSEVIAAFSEIAKELDLSQSAAEKVLSKMGPVMAERSMAQIQEAQAQWTEASMTDKEFGGEKLQENLSVAKKAMDAFATPELKQLLNESGLGNHPEVIRMMYRAGKAISEDGYVGPSQGSGAGQNAPRDFNGYASALYSNQQGN